MDSDSDSLVKDLDSAHAGLVRGLKFSDLMSVTYEDNTHVSIFYYDQRQKPSEMYRLAHF